MFRHRRSRQQVGEKILQEIHRESTQAREFLTAAISKDYEITYTIERETPDLKEQLADIWIEYIRFLRAECGDDEAIEHWRAFCEYGAVTLEVHDV